MLAILWYMHF
ncbi:unnamed protein product [Macrosiphum euphorbiae]|uniref:Uncharacterized protein n=1 Tax=Macrosiphum euphorbiae TaxID=13131 RepID=A0AAV0WSN2_9HEMI|nr:unnamed protein product [Macrosiphum euphorbiae]